MEEIELEYWEDKFKPINGAFYRRFLKQELCLCGWCKFHRNDNLRKSKYLRRSWKGYRKTQWKPLVCSKDNSCSRNVNRGIK